jgi:hypothetical protein
MIRGLEVLTLVVTTGPRSLGTWRITRKYQMLSTTQFGRAADRINFSTGGRIYVIHQETRMVLAAAMFEEQAGPDGTLLLTELALARPTGDPYHGQLDPRAYAAAIFLLERLHDVKHRDGGPTHLWLDHCAGVTTNDCRALGFVHKGFDSTTPPFFRADTADPVNWLSRVWRTLENIQTVLSKR